MLQETININPDIRPLSPQQLATAKAAFTTRRIDKTTIKTLIQGDLKPQSGDLVLARVDEIGHHKRIELKHGRRAILFVDVDAIVLEISDGLYQRETSMLLSSHYFSVNSKYHDLRSR